MSRKGNLSLLILDDSVHLVELYSQFLMKIKKSISVTKATTGQAAVELANKQLFDVLVIDAKLEYQGESFGGLRVANVLARRYGDNSIIVMSGYITEATMAIHGRQFEFLSKGSRPGVTTQQEFAKSLVRTSESIRAEQFAFVAMPFDPVFSEMYEKQIQPGIEDAGFQAVRVDKLNHNKPIQEVIFELVSRSKLVVFLADGANPNAYYEAGFAHALGKEVVTIVKNVSDLKFDIANRNTIVYGSKPRSVRASLKQKLLRLRFEAMK